MESAAPHRSLPAAMATGIGSLPFEDPQEALALILAELPQCPHWPQLPLRSRQEHFVHQFLQPLADCGILVCQNHRWFFDRTSDTSADSLTTFYANCLAAEEGDQAALESFLPPPEAAAGLHAFLSRGDAGGLGRQAAFGKGQIAGPLTIALEMKDEQGRPAYYQGDLRDIIVRNLALNARSQAAAIASLDLIPMVFIDDPVVSAFGSRLHLALGREAIVEDLNFIAAAVHAEKGLVGVHSCEAVDWSLLTDTTVDIISVDTYRFGASLLPYAAQLSDFLMRGHTIAWGIVPTVDDCFDESAASLLQRLNDLWEKLFAEGPPRHQVIRQSMITPACGTGLLSPAQARQIYRLTAAVSASLVDSEK